MKEEIIVQVDATSIIKKAKKDNSWRSIVSYDTNGKQHTNIVRCIDQGKFLEEVHNHGQTSKFILKTKE